RPFGPGDVPDIALGIAPAEAAAPKRLLRPTKELDVGHVLQRFVGCTYLVHRREVDTEREGAKPVGRRPEVRLVALGGVEGYRDAVRELEDPMHRLARGRLRPAECAKDLGHTLDVSAGERDEPDAGRQHRVTVRGGSIV